MLEISDEEFDRLISEAMDVLPAEYIERLNNVAITYQDEPTAEQRQRLKLRPHQSLFGLYEGVPLTRRGNSYNLVPPDKITLFKNPILASVNSLAELKNQITRTLWHEIAHFYGLGHDRIDQLERKAGPDQPST